MFNGRWRNIALNWWIHYLTHELFQTEDVNGWSRAIPRHAQCACHCPFLGVCSSSWICVWYKYKHIDRAFALGSRLLSCAVSSSSHPGKVCANKSGSAWTSLCYNAGVLPCNFLAQSKCISGASMGQGLLLMGCLDVPMQVWRVRI